ncbi:uncharacterized protein MELLADRAFT_95292 [Melampsora larici-populina 98AG31]|uniref:Uncharacterized protein n=1 Tax=Melampsora larici-populina (strain 98AG31 / pathotype 3-4-7) TaxID=747676 RepID=F4RCX1_MELLP|nr:uncharacterized protein MELLADRAFT_95292 [Melampsora larici-populina 98AG31]EGG09916.1 hypothetical protein MELLADRAFT_95292 [Melampsora larici-populina 98AG31]
MSNSTDTLPSTATEDIIFPSSETGTNGTSILNSSHHLSALKAHVIAGIISVVVLIVLLAVVFMLLRRYRRIKSRKEMNSSDRVTARHTTGIAPQTKAVIVDKLKHEERRLEYSDPSRSKLHCKIRPDASSSQRIKNPQPPSYSYYHMDDHNSPSSSSASSSFDDTSPLDSTADPFFDRSTGRTTVTHISPLQTEGPKNLTQLPYNVFAKAVFTREAPNVDRYRLRPSRLNRISRSPTPTNLEALETIVACVDYEYKSDHPTAQEGQDKSRANAEPEKPETPSPVTPENSEGSPEQRAEERSSMIGRGESYYCVLKNFEIGFTRFRKNPPRIRTP